MNNLLSLQYKVYPITDPLLVVECTLQGKYTMYLKCKAQIQKFHRWEFSVWTLTKECTKIYVQRQSLWHYL